MAAVPADAAALRNTCLSQMKTKRTWSFIPVLLPETGNAAQPVSAENPPGEA